MSFKAVPTLSTAALDAAAACWDSRNSRSASSSAALLSFANCLSCSGLSSPVFVLLAVAADDEEDDEEEEGGATVGDCLRANHVPGLNHENSDVFVVPVPVAVVAVAVVAVVPAVPVVVAVVCCCL